MTVYQGFNCFLFQYKQGLKITSDDISNQPKTTFIALNHQKFALKKKLAMKNVCFCLA